MNRKPLFTTAIIASALLLAGCTAAPTANLLNSQNSSNGALTTTASTTNGDLAPSTVMSENADYTTVNPDEWSESEAVDVALTGSGATSDSSAVSSSGSTVTISEAGVYRLSGSLDGGVVVAAPDDALVVLVLNGVEISNNAGAAIEVQTADDVAIHLADGSANSVSDAASYAENAAANAAIHSESDLTISGTGSLTVQGNGNDGIASKDDLVILGGSIVVSAADDALRGKDALVVEGGELELTADAGDGLKSDGDDGAEVATDIDWSGGYIYVSGGSIDITAGDDGLQAFTDTVIVGGSVTLSAADDGVKAEVVVSIGDDGADESPTVTVESSTEGIEAANIGIGGGTIDVTASDDGLNASGNTELQALMSGTAVAESTESTETAEMGGGGGGAGGEFADTGERLEIFGGALTVDAEGDGIDSNGALAVSGGDTVVYGPTMGANGSIDANGAITVSGGMLVSFGPGTMEQTPSAGEQGWVFVSAQIGAGETVTIVDESGDAIAEATSRKSASTVIFSSPDVTTGSSYSVVSGSGAAGSVLGTAVAGEGGAAGFGGGPGGAPGGGMPGGGPGQPQG